MLLYPVRKNSGFTLIEVIVVTIIVGIVGAISVPSFFAFLSRNQINNSLEHLLGGIKETQQQAMRQGIQCRVNIDTSTNTLTSDPNSCLLSIRNLDDNITIRTNLPGGTPGITFSPKGTTTSAGTIVLSSDNTDLQRCFVISLGLGIMRTGNYTGASTGPVDFTECEASS